MLCKLMFMRFFSRKQYDAVSVGKLNMNADYFKPKTSSNSTFRSFAAPKFEKP